MSGTMLLYRNIKVLSRDAHRRLRLRPVEGVSFAAGMHWAPVAGVEFTQASLSYPIVFVGERGADGAETVTPIVLLGLSAGHNDYIMPDHNWRPGSYIPAFIRRYPFIFASASGKADELTVCFDADFEGLNEQEGVLLFNEDGSNGALLQETINLMDGLNAEMERTREFVRLLQDFDLLVERTLDIRTDDDALFQIPGFLVVDETRLSNLADERMMVLNQKGFLAWILSHQASLSNLANLLELHLESRRAAAGA